MIKSRASRSYTTDYAVSNLRSATPRSVLDSRRTVTKASLYLTANKQDLFE